MKKASLWLALLFLLSTILYGCGGGSAKMEAASQTADMAPGAYPATQSSEESKPAREPASGTGTPSLDRKIILNAQLDVRVSDADESIATITQNVRAAGGYVQENRVEGTKQDGRRVTMTVRVPAGAYGSMVDLVAGLGEVNNRREWTNDVTEEYLDLDARIATKEAHLAQLRKLYAQGGTIKELMELESEIARVTAELESIKGRFNYLSNQVAFSTIVVALYEPGVPAPIKEPKTVWERMRNGFVSSWNGVVNFTAEVAIFIVSSIPALVYLVVLGLIGWGILRLIQRRRGGGHGGGGHPPRTGPMPPPVGPNPYQAPGNLVATQDPSKKS